MDWSTQMLEPPEGRAVRGPLANASVEAAGGHHLAVGPPGDAVDLLLVSSKHGLAPPIDQ